jgi:hypothetical protein
MRQHQMKSRGTNAEYTRAFGGIFDAKLSNIVTKECFSECEVQAYRSYSVSPDMHIKKSIGTIQSSIFTELLFVNIGFHSLESEYRVCQHCAIIGKTYQHPPTSHIQGIGKG